MSAREWKIRFNRPTVYGTEVSSLEEVARSAGPLGGEGPFTRKCEELLAARLGSAAILVSSATSALEMMALLLKLGPGDEVILPSFTFVSTANAFALRGARIVFADCDDSGNIDLNHVARLLTERTRALCVVHYGGSACNMHRAAELCAEAGITLLEDAAQAIGASFDGRPLGTFGAMSCISFHETKNLTCGEGGALIVNERKLWEPAQVVKQKGTNRLQFRRGFVDKYTWVGLGSSYLLSELNAAFLYQQLLHMDEITARRKSIGERYLSYFRSRPRFPARLLEGLLGANANAHLVGLELPDESSRARLQEFLASRGIESVIHYVPLHSSPFAQENPQLIRTDGNYPMTNRLGKCLLRLPIYHSLTEEMQREIFAAFDDYLAMDLQAPAEKELPAVAVSVH